MSGLTSDKFNEWTACETNGHQYEDAYCFDPVTTTACENCPCVRFCVYCGDEYDQAV